MNKADLICLLCMREKQFPEQMPCPHCGGDDRTLGVQSPALPPRTVLDGRYVLGKTLGQGGFGITYQAYDLRMNNTVAVKEYFPSSIVGRDSTVTNLVTVNAVKGGRAQAEYASGLRHFLNEARRQARMASSPGVVSVTDFFEANNTAYYVMEYVDGCDLVKYVRESQPLSTVLELLEPIAQSLIQIHAEGMIHRDISPDNIMCAKNGSRKLLDFGASHSFTEDESTTGNATLKHGFAPPEQYGSSSMQGPWTDVYAFAATIYWCITGKVPQDSMDRSIGGDQLRRPIELGAVLTPEAEQVLLRGMTLAVTARYQNMQTFWNSLKKANEKHQQEETASGNPTEPPERTQVSNIVTKTERPAYYYDKEEPEVTMNTALPVRPQRSGRQMEQPVVNQPVREEPALEPELPVPEEPAPPVSVPEEPAPSVPVPEEPVPAPPQREEPEREIPKKRRLSISHYAMLAAIVVLVVLLAVTLTPGKKQSQPDSSEPVVEAGSVTVAGETIPVDTTELYITGNSHYTTQRFSNLSFITAEGLTEQDMDTIGELTGLKKLYLVDLELKDLSTLASLKNLTELCLYGNHISDVKPLSKLTGLTWLDLGSNHLTTTEDLGGLTSLVRLYLQDNAITDLSGLENLSALQTLNLTNNHPDSPEELKSLSAMTMLSVSGCGFTNHQLLELTEALPDCALDVDVVTNIPENVKIGGASYSTSSTSLYLVDQDLTDSDLSNLKYMVDLTVLDLSGNRITNLSVLSQLPALTEVHLEKTSVTDITVLSQLYHLEWLSLAGSPVSDLTPLKHLTELHYLDLSGTKVEDLSPVAGLTNITQMDISSSKVSDLTPLTGYEKLRLLIMKSCPVTDLTPLYEITSLREVQLSGNAYSKEERDAVSEHMPGCLVTTLN